MAMNHKKNEFSNSIIKDRIEILENSKHKLMFRTFLAPGGGQNQLHYHSKLIEKFKVVQGELNVIINDTEKVLTTDNEQIIPRFANHMFYNQSNKQVIFDVEVLNPQKMINGLQIIYGLTNDGKTNSEGMPNNIFHTAIGLKMMDAFSPKIPYLIQKIGILTLTMLGKIMGIEKMLIKKYCF